MATLCELTAEVIEDVRKLLPKVMYLETVADYVGVSRSQFHRWLKRGTKEHKRLTRVSGAEPLPAEALYLEFRNVYRKALAESEIFATRVIRKASKAQWQAAAWLLERRFRERWGSDRAEVRQLERELRELEELLRERVRHTGQATGGYAQGRSPAGSRTSDN